MFKKSLLALFVLLGLVGISSQAQASVYTLHQFNVDDDLFAYITNSTFTNQLLLHSTFGDDQTVDFTAFTVNGPNTLNFVLTSSHGGWAYGYDVKKDGVTIDSGACGTIRVIGCNNNDGATGTVFTHQFTFDVGTVTGGTAPEPASVLLTGMGFVGLAAFLKRKTRSVI
jgi:hypothetical protein